MKKALENLVKLYYTDKKYQEVLEIAEDILATKVEDIEIVKQYSKKINETIPWVESVYNFKIRALLRFEG